MFAAELIFNLCLLGLDGAALAAIARRPRAFPLALLAWGSLLVPAAALAAGAAPFMKGFFFLRLLCWALFLHGPLCWLGVSLLRWRAGARRQAGLALLPALALLAVAADAFLYEPQALQVREVVVPAPRLTAPLRVVVIADLQTDRIGAHERAALARVADLKPDLLLWAGDYLQCWDAESHAREAANLRAALAQSGIRPRLGSYAVRGDCERQGWEPLFAGTGVAPLQSAIPLGADLRLQGLSLTESARGAPPLPESERFTIAFGHRPDFALHPCDADLLLAGHTHGGQVQLPGIGPLMTLSEVPRDWAGGAPTRLPSGALLVVARGVGMERFTAPRLRFGCRPELLVLELRPEP